MSAEDKEPFLSRWSRRKLDLEKAEAAPKPVADSQPAAAAPAAVPAPPELPPIDSLRGLASEYKDFLHPQVQEKLRQAALKKLFHDPHFNVMDGLDTYIDDYSKADPIPEAMLKTLAHAKGLLFGDEEKKDAHAAAEPPAAQPLPEAAEKPEAQSEAKAEAPPASPAEPEGKV